MSSMKGLVSIMKSVRMHAASLVRNTESDMMKTMGLA